MINVSYSQKLRDPRWQKRRLEIMELDEFACRRCGSKTETLNVHHLIYHKGASPWEYEDNELITLCEPCHEHAEDAETLRDFRRFMALFRGDVLVMRNLSWILCSLTKDYRDHSCLDSGTAVMKCAIDHFSVKRGRYLESKRWDERLKAAGLLDLLEEFEEAAHSEPEITA